MRVRSVRIERFPLKYPLRITGFEFADAEVAVVEVEQYGARGRGECSGVYYRNDSPEHCAAEIQRVEHLIAGGVGREELLEILPAGGARNALDAALWDLEAKLSGRPVWQLAGGSEPHSLLTTQTLGADEPRLMAERAGAATEARALKLKLTGTPTDRTRVKEVRAARPDVWLGVDANQGFTRASLEELLPDLVEAGVGLIEQPLPVGEDAQLAGLNSPIPVAVDESVQDLADVAPLAEYYDVVNIKLDKCGGLTRALAIEKETRRLGLKVMVGCMGGTSLAMAPGYVLGQRCDYVDLDAPLILVRDRSPSAIYRDGHVECPPDLWGS